MNTDDPRYPKPDPEIEALLNKVIGAAIEVHRGMGPAHREEHYENALCHELDLMKIPYERQKVIRVEYKGKVVGEGRIDLFVAGRLVVELKAVESIHDVFLATVRWYLEVVNEPLGVVLNFRVPAMNSKNAIRRVVRGRV